MGRAFVVVCVMIAIATCVIELTAFGAVANDSARQQVFSIDRQPAFNDDVRVGQARLNAEIGFMHMDLNELSSYFKNNVSGQADVYQYQCWKLPSIFVYEGGGDCEDYVLFALAVLDHSQYDLKPCVGTFLGEGHAFLIVDDNVLVDAVGGVQPMPSDFSSSYVIGQEYSDMLEGGLF